MTITAETKGVEEVDKLLLTLPAWTYDGARSALADYVFAVDASIKKQVTNQDLHVRTGNLRRSFNFEVHGSKLSDLGASNFNTAVYAPIHQYGGTIYAKKAYMGLPGGPYLNIPLPPNKTPAGVQRMSAGQVFAAGGYIIKTKSSWKAPYVVRLLNQNMFALVKYVDIPKRLNFVETAEKGIQGLVQNMADLAIEKGNEV